jgi:ABC-type transport system involved in cytochrome bd biosynthesis fused ATPase/permease subunit
MEQLDPEDGLAVWDFTQGSDAAGGNFASPSRAWTSGWAALLRPARAAVSKAPMVLLDEPTA